MVVTEGKTGIFGVGVLDDGRKAGSNGVVRRNIDGLDFRGHGRAYLVDVVCRSDRVVLDLDAFFFGQLFEFFEFGSRRVVA